MLRYTSIYGPAEGSGRRADVTSPATGRNPEAQKAVSEGVIDQSPGRWLLGIFLGLIVLKWFAE